MTIFWETTIYVYLFMVVRWRYNSKYNKTDLLGASSSIG